MKQISKVATSGREISEELHRSESQGLLRSHIGAVLKSARTAQGQTLRQLSRKACVSLGYLSEIERGQKEASSELLAAICSALALPLAQLLIDVAHSLADSGANSLAKVQTRPSLAIVALDNTKSTEQVNIEHAA